MTVECVVVQAPCGLWGFGRQVRGDFFKSLRDEAMGAIEGAFACKHQAGATKIMKLVASLFEQVAQTSGVAHETVCTGQCIAIGQAEQGDAALRGDHAGNGPAGAFGLVESCEGEGLLLERLQMGRKTWESLGVQVATLQAFKVDPDQVAFWFCQWRQVSPCTDEK